MSPVTPVNKIIKKPRDRLYDESVQDAFKNNIITRGIIITFNSIEDIHGAQYTREINFNYVKHYMGKDKININKFKYYYCIQKCSLNFDKNTQKNFKENVHINKAEDCKLTFSIGDIMGFTRLFEILYFEIKNDCKGIRNEPGKNIVECKIIKDHFLEAVKIE